jgi:nuclear transport factor 2 (NTF2) superfamily protein
LVGAQTPGGIPGFINDIERRLLELEKIKREETEINLEHAEKVQQLYDPDRFWESNEEIEKHRAQIKKLAEDFNKKRKEYHEKWKDLQVRMKTLTAMGFYFEVRYWKVPRGPLVPKLVPIPPAPPPMPMATPVWD